MVGANPIPIPHPSNLALFVHKLTLYSIYNTYNAQLMQSIPQNQINQGGLILLQEGLKSEQGAEPPGSLTLTTDWTGFGGPPRSPDSLFGWGRRHLFHSLLSRRLQRVILAPSAVCLYRCQLNWQCKCRVLYRIGPCSAVLQDS